MSVASTTNTILDRQDGILSGTVSIQFGIGGLIVRIVVRQNRSGILKECIKPGYHLLNPLGMSRSDVSGFANIVGKIVEHMAMVSSRRIMKEAKQFPILLVDRNAWRRCLELQWSEGKSEDRAVAYALSFENR